LHLKFCCTVMRDGKYAVAGNGPYKLPYSTVSKIEQWK
jgi:hypothetical protein